MRTHAPRHRRRGFTTLLAIILLAFVGMALLTLSQTTLADVRYTGREQVDAQLRQLLRAGEMVAREETAQTGRIHTASVSFDADRSVDIAGETSVSDAQTIVLTAKFAERVTRRAIRIVDATGFRN